MSDRARKPSGFTLIEVMAVVALIGFVFFIALNFYTDLSNASNQASNHTRGIRRASAILDRVARDIEGAMLIVKPPEMDPLAFPWIFLGERSLGGDTAERLKFITRNHKPARTDAPETDLATVAYVAESRPDDSIALYRWSSPHLPESLDKSFPRGEDEGAFLLAEDLYSFGFLFIGEDGLPQSEWDSSTIIESGALPVAVEIQLSLWDEKTSDLEEPPIYSRKVAIPIRPLDLVALADPNDPIFGTGEKKESEEGDEDDDDEDDDDRDDDEPPSTPALTNKDCFDKTAPPGATLWQKTCVGLANSKPDMAFTPQDYAGMPEECKELVKPACRR